MEFIACSYKGQVNWKNQFNLLIFFIYLSDSFRTP